MWVQENFITLIISKLFTLFIGTAIRILVKPIKIIIITVGSIYQDKYEPGTLQRIAYIIFATILQGKYNYYSQFKNRKIRVEHSP